MAENGPNPTSSSQTQDQKTRFLSVETKWLVLAAIGVGTFMSALDGSVVNTILPVITEYFHTNVATVEWVVTTYLLVVSGLLLLVGRLGDLRGNRNTYVSGFGIFVAGSALCGLSPAPIYLILARGFQAIGAAMLFANSPAILTKAFPAEQRGQALGLQGAMTYLGLTTGPFLGGWLSDHFGWHSIFYINVPIGIVAIWLGLTVIPPDTPSDRREPFDLSGAFAFMVGLVALLFALNQGHNWGWLSPIILGLLLVSFLTLGLFVQIERRVAAPMLDLSLFERRVFTVSTISPVLNYICIYSALFLTPFYLIQARGLSASQAGLILTAQPIVMALTAPLSGTLSDRVGSRIPTTLGLLIFGGGLFVLSQLTLTSQYSLTAVGLAICGLGTGLFVAPNNSALMGDAPRNRQGIAAGVLALARNVGMVLGIGLTGAIFTTILARGNQSDPSALVHAFDISLLFTSGVAVLGAVVSYARGDDRPARKRKVESRK
jgi:EmrB/QacA subfamily drug resistance transporter